MNAVVFPTDLAEKLAALPVFPNLNHLRIGSIQASTFNKEAFKIFVNVSFFKFKKML